MTSKLDLATLRDYSSESLIALHEGLRQAISDKRDELSAIKQILKDRLLDVAGAKILPHEEYVVSLRGVGTDPVTINALWEAARQAGIPIERVEKAYTESHIHEGCDLCGTNGTQVPDRWDRRVLAGILRFGGEPADIIKRSETFVNAAIDIKKHKQKVSK